MRKMPALVFSRNGKEETTVLPPSLFVPQPCFLDLAFFLTYLQGCQMAYFQTKIPIWINVRGSYNERWGVYFMAIWSILLQFGILCGHMVYFMVLWYIFPVLVYYTKKNLATLLISRLVPILAFCLSQTLNPYNFAAVTMQR
jgi:hypothetical protein